MQQSNMCRRGALSTSPHLGSVNIFFSAHYYNERDFDFCLLSGAALTLCRVQLQSPLFFGRFERRRVAESRYLEESILQTQNLKEESRDMLTKVRDVIVKMHNALF